MKAVILAAGRGTRIERVTQGKPKCLLAFGDRTILDYQIDALSAVGVSKIAIVIGHNGHCIVDHVRAAHRHRLGKLHFVLNPEFGRTNNIYSLWLARDWVGERLSVPECRRVVPSADPHPRGGAQEPCVNDR